MNGRAFLRAFFTLLVVAIVGSILYWLVGYLDGLWGFPPFATKLLYTLLVLAAVVFVIDALLGIVEKNFIRWQ